MIILTFDEVISLNKYIKEKTLPFKIHLRDACGGQYFRVEFLGGGDFGELEKAVSEFAEKLRAKPVFSKDMSGFRFEKI